MTNRFRAAVTGTLLCCLAIGCRTANGAAAYRAGFVRVRDGVRLHYLDWGGTGPDLVLLAGLGGSAHTFDDLAPELTHSFRVIAITRRGTGESDRPDSGYDVPSRARDDLDVLDSLKIARAIFVGHSIAGDELSELGAHSPERVAGLVYLDAAYPRSQEPTNKISDPARGVVPVPKVHTFDELLAKRRASPLGLPKAMETDLEVTQRGEDGELTPSPPIPILLAMMRASKGWQPDYKAIKAPIIAIFAFSPEHPMADLALQSDDSLTRSKWNAWWRRDYWAWQEGVIASLKKDVPSAQIVVLRPADHLVYFSNKADVIAAIHSLAARLVH